ncbi:hypothetical protein HDV00_010575 [Rhizophlyctis rosea]|nr:hypothetical protein HDV00_010575 [Rhizophlyctis rosea]
MAETSNPSQTLSLDEDNGPKGSEAKGKGPVPAMEEQTGAQSHAQATELEGSSAAVIPPVPTDEHRTALQAATIDTYSPSVAATVHSSEHLTDDTATHGASSSASKPVDESTASNQGHPTPHHAYEEDENDPDSVLAQLLSMGFDVNTCEVAIAECVTDRTSGRGAGHQSLLEMSIGWIIARQGGDEPRGVRYSPVPSPKPSRPPPPDARPAKSILKVGQSPPVSRGPSQSMFKRPEWLSSKMDQAAEVLGLSFTKLRSSTTSRDSARGSSDSVAPAPTEPAPAQNASNPFVISASSDSLSSFLNDIAPPGHTPLSKLPKHVRFSFPDITIDPEPDFTPDPEELKTEPSPPGTPPSEDQQHMSENERRFQTVQRQRSSENEPGWKEDASVEVQREEGRVPDLLAEDLMNYYHQTCDKKGEPYIEKLDVQMRNAAQTSGVLVKIDLSGMQNCAEWLATDGVLTFEDL